MLVVMESKTGDPDKQQMVKSMEDDRVTVSDMPFRNGWALQAIANIQHSQVRKKTKSLASHALFLVGTQTVGKKLSITGV